jgi:hypothetical protein
MITQMLLFWLSCAMVAAGLVLIAKAVWRRRMTVAVLTAILVAVNACNAGFWWQMEGACLLPHPSVIEFRPGMTMCPGQSTTLMIEAPVRERGSGDRGI